MILATGVTRPRTAVIVPAYNEAERITPVLEAVTGAHGVDEVIVVTDGSTDDTPERVRHFAQTLCETQPPLRIFELEHNIGKGGAMTYGAHRTDAGVLLFLDADLIGLQPAQVAAMLEPMLHPDCESRADMTLGLFGAPRGGLFGWWLGVCHRKAAFITGQRAIRRDVFLAVPDLTRSRFGVETAITRYVSHVWKLRVDYVSLHGVTHPIKEEKNGLLRGLRHRLKMYGEIASYLALDTARNSASTRHRQQAARMRQHFSDNKL